MNLTADTGPCRSALALGGIPTIAMVRSTQLHRLCWPHRGQARSYRLCVVVLTSRTAFLTLLMTWVIGAGHVTTESEVLERLHLVLLVQGVRGAVVE